MLTQQEKNFIILMEKNVEIFNKNKAKENQLSFQLYEFKGNKVDLYKDNKLIASSMTIAECHFAITAIVNYNRKDV